MNLCIYIGIAVNYQPEQPHSLINFKGTWYDNFIHSSNGPLLSFEQNEKGRQHTTCLRTSGYKHGHSMVDQWDPRAVEDFSCFETASNGDWLYYDEVVFADSSSIQDPGSLKLISSVPIWDKLVVELGLDLFAVNDEKFKDTFVSPAAIEVLQHKLTIPSKSPKDDEVKTQNGERSKHYAEIGWSKNQEAGKTNPKLAAMNKKFGISIFCFPFS
ncbi:hypothetical protein GOBAR_DD10340 [Gossypium barbadense]|nr:hypothetical protein GOBAR_DD10340 [Gossypium barbadense]